ncbi:MAG TPA: alpha/beta hydrolase [Spirochaetia bacterium]|nr:alpha/beta hydrolase [Spirochaetales bacterium]HPD80479.1 alpha/beta hydrolase [Spirochaetales bacterium]HQK34085.1 alpha/beta hydrolase [Spirochaetales bacterium]HRS66540.1 alpha/beta hydrolase [Spirochaetia bacterium]HRV28647.1 alpha/beta hydrolase [Spirochaetia bacterium]
MKKILKITGFAILSLLVLGTSIFFIWAKNPSMAREVALNSLKSDDKVNVVETKQYITFETIENKSEIGFIFYPGGHVDFRSYAPILHRIAAEGIFVVLVRVKLDLAFFDVDAGARFLEEYPHIKIWTTGGTL